jgi:methylmalonyl-CoA mutase N-terminal domain/subunit
MPPTIAAVKVRTSGGEIVAALKTVFGTYTETPVF